MTFYVYSPRVQTKDRKEFCPLEVSSARPRGNHTLDGIFDLVRPKDGLGTRCGGSVNITATIFSSLPASFEVIHWRVWTSRMDLLSICTWKACWISRWTTLPKVRSFTPYLHGHSGQKAKVTTLSLTFLPFTPSSLFHQHLVSTWVPRSAPLHSKSNPYSLFQVRRPYLLSCLEHCFSAFSFLSHHTLHIAKVMLLKHTSTR